MATQRTKKTGDVFRMHEAFVNDLTSCGIPAPTEVPGNVRRDINSKFGGERVAGGPQGFNGEVELVTDSKIVMRKVKQTLTQVEQASKKSKSAKVKKFFQSLLQKKAKDDKKKVIEVEVPSIVVDVKMWGKLGGETYNFLGFSCDSTEAEKLIAKGLAKEP